MLLLSCLFGQGPQCKGMKDASPIRAHDIAQERPPSLTVSCERASPNQASNAERTGNGSSKAEPQKPSSFPGKASNVTPGHVLKTSLAAQLLDGLTFTPEVLGVGSYGLVLHGKYNQPHLKLLCTVQYPPNPTTNGFFAGFI